jgi:hypothetical protein
MQYFQPLRTSEGVLCIWKPFSVTEDVIDEAELYEKYDYSVLVIDFHQEKIPRRSGSNMDVGKQYTERTKEFIRAGVCQRP